MRDPIDPCVDVPIAESPLGERGVGVAGVGETAVEVERVEQRDADARLTGRLDECVAHRVAVRIRRPVGLVMEVVELADAGDARHRHLGERRSRQPVVGVGLEPFGGPVHQVTPRPERAAVPPASAIAVPDGTHGCARSRGRAA